LQHLMLSAAGYQSPPFRPSCTKGWHVILDCTISILTIVLYRLWHDIGNAQIALKNFLL